MKRILSIFFALIILVSGMHLSVPTHFCGGEVAAVKWSFTGEKATCGMESDEQSTSSKEEIASNCCKNEISVLAVDNNYNPSSIQIKEITKNLLQVFNVPVNIAFQSYTASTSYSAIISPPDNLLASAVSLPNICTFRI